MNFVEAIAFLEKKNEIESMWRMRACTILQLIGKPGVDMNKVISLARESADEGNKL